jgi:hypothetical protein
MHDTGKGIMHQAMYLVTGFDRVDLNYIASAPQMVQLICSI